MSCKLIVEHPTVTHRQSVMSSRAQFNLRTLQYYNIEAKILKSHSMNFEAKKLE